MDLLDQLGLGGIFGSYPSAYLQQQMQQNWASQQQIQQHYPSQCIHFNCPICAEQIKKAQELKIEQEKFIAERKLAYENRCKDYMKKFRRSNGKKLRRN